MVFAYKRTLQLDNLARKPQIACGVAFACASLKFYPKRPDPWQPHEKNGGGRKRMVVVGKEWWW